MTIQIRHLIELERFVEVLYFGALELALNPTSELHLYLGLACCASIKPIAQIERELAPDKIDTSDRQEAYLGRLTVGRSTTLVNEGLHHLLQATHLEPEIQFPSSFEPITLRILQDLQDYLGQEFRGFTISGLNYSLKTAGLATLVLLARLQGLAPDKAGVSSDIRIQIADELLSELSSSKIKLASFYKLISE